MLGSVPCRAVNELAIEQVGGHRQTVLAVSGGFILSRLLATQPKAFAQPFYGGQTQLEACFGNGYYSA